MSADLRMLIYTELLYFLLVFLYSLGRWATPGGFAWAFGNREKPLASFEWVERTVRTQQNLVENAIPFAVLVIVAHVTGKTGPTSDFGATVFFGARCAHALAYIAGVRYLRSLLWLLSLSGEAAILYALWT